ncbi:hypothetical protein GCM10010372_81080 [Streptomyces tauricus]|nr:hypothetical protein GCM10010372_81080 [Streptomyces tauricus]
MAGQLASDAICGPNRRLTGSSAVPASGGLPDAAAMAAPPHVGVRIARKGIDSSERLGRRRSVIERTVSWLTGDRRLSPCYKRNPRNYMALLGLTASLYCYKRLRKLTK